MGVLVAMLYERYKAGKYPLSLFSMDNCSQNGARLRESVLTMTDKITPRPSEQIAED